MNEDGPKRKPLLWLGDSRKRIRSFSWEVRREMGEALDVAQLGGKSGAAKPLRGFGGGSVLEVVEQHEGNAYRAVYTVRFPRVVYVLHAFQKKSRRGIETPKAEIDLVRQRLMVAEVDYSQWEKENPDEP